MFELIYYLENVKKGFEARSGVSDKDGMYTTTSKLNAADFEAVAAEAFNQGVFGAEKTTWDDALKQVKEGLKEISKELKDTVFERLK